MTYIHFANRKTLTRLNTAVMLGLVGSGLAACAIGALIYDVGRLLWLGKFNLNA
jgi:hypothetical protein